LKGPTNENMLCLFHNEKSGVSPELCNTASFDLEILLSNEALY